MARTVDPPYDPTHNQLLASLSAPDRGELLREAQNVALEPWQVVVVQGEPVSHVYFPLDGLCALLGVMSNGRTVVTAVVGIEGLVGTSGLLADERSPIEAVCHAAGTVLKIPAEHVRRQVHERPSVRDVLLAYVIALLGQTQRNAACNRLHEVEPRLARWLLTVCDRLGASSLPMTQEHLGALLGVRRASVSKAAEALQNRGLIRYSRGQLLLVNRLELEAAACECYTANAYTGEPRPG